MNKDQEFQGEFHIVDLSPNGPQDSITGTGTKDWKRYRTFTIYEDAEDSHTHWLDGTFKNYDHFTGVFGKFDPYSRFLAKPLKANPDYESLTEALAKLPEGYLDY